MKSSVVCLLLVLLPVIAFAQKDVMILDHPEAFKKKQRSPVVFTHADHVRLDALGCKDCHHRYEKGLNVLDEGELSGGSPLVVCASCHSRGSSVNLRKAFHRQCMTCHRTMIKQKKKSGPITCAQCHPRAE